eukprot:c5372_g2_i1 orf=39-272(+)
MEFQVIREKIVETMLSQAEKRGREGNKGSSESYREILCFEGHFFVACSSWGNLLCKLLSCNCIGSHDKREKLVQDLQ